MMRKPLSSIFAAAGLAPASLFLGLFLPGSSWGIPANPKAADLLQPDGTRVKISLKGDEFHHWHEDNRGYTVIRDSATRNWVYGEKGADGVLKAGRYKVGAYDPARLGLAKHLTDVEKLARGKTRRAQRDSSSPFRVSGTGTVAGAQAPPGPARTPILTGTMKNLVILARFSDQAATYTPAQFSDLFNKAGYNADGAAGSVQDYYKQISYNLLTIQSTVTAWVALPNNAAYYGANVGGEDNNPRQMVIDAINALDAAGFNFADVDANGDGDVDGLTIIHSGRGEEWSGNSSDYIWSHQWTLDTPVFKDGKKMQMYHTEPEVRGWDGDPPGITRIGVICHETGHFLGLPDLYDYGGDSKGAGNFCLMAGGSWNGDYGSSPAHMSAWPKKTLGWATATQISVIQPYSLARIEDDQTALYLLKGPAFPAAEYFLMENRQGYGFDSGLPGSLRGVLIWHVDESKADNDDQTHYKVDLEEAGGTQHLEQNVNSGDDQDYFRLGNNTAFGDNTVPNSKSYPPGSNILNRLIQDISASGSPMTFYLGGEDTTPPTNIATVYDGATIGLDIATTGSSTTLSANWTASSDPQSGIMGYWYAIGTSPGLSDAAAWVYNGPATSVTRNSLSLNNGVIYYFSVKAENTIGLLSNTTSSNGQQVDTDIPINVPYVYDGLSPSEDQTYVASLNTLSGNWGASPSGNIAKYWYAIGTNPGGTDTRGWTDNALLISTTASGLSLTEGVTYYFAVRAQNIGGFYSSTSASNGQIVLVTSPTARILISSVLPAKTGNLRLKLIVTAANGIIGNPVLKFTPVGGSARDVALNYLVSSTWTGIAYIESFLSTGTAAFAFGATDPAGNSGSLVTTGGSFVIDTSVSGAAGGTVSNSDGAAVVLPPLVYSGSLVVNITTVTASRTAAADASAYESYPLYASDLRRELTARDAASGASVADFNADVTVKLCYPDSDNDGHMDGDYLAENAARLYLLDENLNKWTLIENAVPDIFSNCITALTPHFSVYAIRVMDASKYGMPNIKAYPNPCYFDTPPFTLTIAGIPLDASGPEIYIYNAAGELVRTLARGDGIDFANKAVWDGKNRSGGRAASGLYVYAVRTANYGKASGRFYIFR